MAVANVEKLYQMALNDPGIVIGLWHINERARFIDRAIRIGQSHGLSFTAEEVNTWIKQKLAGGQAVSYETAKGISPDDTTGIGDFCPLP